MRKMRNEKSNKIVMAARAAVIIALSLLSSCSTPKTGPDAKAGPNAPLKDKKEINPASGKAPLAAGAFKTVAPEALGNLTNEPELVELRKRGLFKAALPCNRPGMCTINSFGVPVGFEVELVRKITERGLGVKENFVQPGAAGADVRMAVSCGGPGSNPATEESGPKLIPYFYRSDTGWLCFEIINGGATMSDAMERIIRYLYDTGTFQQVYKNWFPPEAPDIVPHP